MADDLIEIHQEWAQGSGIKIQLKKQRELRVEKHSKRGSTKYTIDLLALGDKSKQKVILGWQWFVAGLAAIFLMIACLNFLPILEESTLYQAATYVLGLGLGAACFLWQLRAHPGNKYFFHVKLIFPLLSWLSIIHQKMNSIVL